MGDGTYTDGCIVASVDWMAADGTDDSSVVVDVASVVVVVLAVVVALVVVVLPVSSTGVAQATMPMSNTVQRNSADNFFIFFAPLVTGRSGQSPVMFGL